MLEVAKEVVIDFLARQLVTGVTRFFPPSERDFVLQQCFMVARGIRASSYSSQLKTIDFTQDEIPTDPDIDRQPTRRIKLSDLNELRKKGTKE